MSPWVQAGDDLILSVRLTPGSAMEEVGGAWTDAQGGLWFCARVRAVPEKGRANRAVIALLAKALDWPKGAILLETGDTNRLKRLRIRGGASATARLAPIIATWVQAT